jgi:peptidyl-prolyl cis-trans isomerase B (cyclophilin B)
VASSKREKELARQRAERQAARRTASQQRTKQRQAIVASVVAVLLVAAAAVAAALAVGGNDDGGADVAAPAASVAPSEAGATPSASPSAEPGLSPAPSAAAANGEPGCEYVETAEESPREVKLPPTEGVETEKIYDVTMQTNQGDIVFRMDSAETPCTSNNLRSLAHFRYFDDTTCHRLTTQGISVLQCGDPTGTGTGGPGYSFADENLEGATYPRGTVAMANAGPGTNGSQFFLVYEDSQLPPNYTPFGVITEGLDVLDKVAAAGSDGSNGAGDGRPNLEVRIETLRAKEVTP